MPLSDRYANQQVDDVFRDNILLTLSYLTKKILHTKEIDWGKIHQSASYELTLSPGEIFAFHDSILSQYQGKKVETTNAHFDASEGFVSDGYLYGDGVCHLASLLNWVAQDAGLSVNAPTDHSFAIIPDIPAKYGTAIYSAPENQYSSALQNLYIENTYDVPVKFVFKYENDVLTVTVEKTV